MDLFGKVLCTYAILQTLHLWNKFGEVLGIYTILYTLHLLIFWLGIMYLDNLTYFSFMDLVW